MSGVEVMVDHSYGKESVHLCRKIESESGSTFRELWVTFDLHGGMADSYRHGDNSMIIPSDALKNRVLAYLAMTGDESLEALSVAIAMKLLEGVSSVDQVQVSMREIRWIADGSIDWPYLKRTPMPGEVEVVLERENISAPKIFGTLQVEVLRGGSSSFMGFLRDEFTDQNDVVDRVLKGTVTCRYRHGCLVSESDEILRDSLCTKIVSEFSNTSSRSVQETLYGVASTAMREFPSLEELELRFSSAPMHAISLGSEQELGSGLWIVGGSNNSVTSVKLGRET